MTEEIRCPLTDEGNENMGCFKDSEIKRLKEALRYVMFHRNALGQHLIDLVPEPKQRELHWTLRDSPRNPAERRGPTTPNMP